MTRCIRRLVELGLKVKAKYNPPDTGLKIGDRVRLVSETPLRKSEMDLQGQIGEVVECPQVKLVTVRCPGGRLLMGRDAELFERV